MDPLLPAAEQLKKLPLRAVVAYATRTASRLSSALRGIVSDAILDDVLGVLNAVSKAAFVGDISQGEIAAAAHRLTEAYAAAPLGLKSPAKFRVVFALTHSSLAAISMIEAVVRRECAVREMESAVKEAQRTVGAIAILDHEAARVAALAARQDYDVLLREYGQHDEVVIGAPIECFDNVP